MWKTSIFILYSLSLAMKPKLIMTVDENLKPKEVQLMIGQAVDIVGQTGNPRAYQDFKHIILLLV